MSEQINGRVSDGGIIENTAFYNRLQNGQLNISKPESIQGSDFVMNYVFVGDEIFTLRLNFFNPFRYKDLTPELRIFNYRTFRT